DRLLHLEEELDVRTRLLQLAQNDLERLLGVQAREGAAQLPRDLDLVDREQHLLATGARRVDVDGREDALVGQRARQAQLAVSGALELFEDDLVHLGTGLDQRGREDRERSAVLDVPRGTEESLRRIQGRRVHATGEHAA